MAGVGLPIFKAALEDNEWAVEEKIEELIEGIKITSMLTSSSTLSQLKGKLVKGHPYGDL